MKYIITRVLVILNNKMKIKYNFEDDKITDLNSTNDINEYRKKIKNRVAQNENINKDDIALIRLTYYEQDGRE